MSNSEGLKSGLALCLMAVTLSMSFITPASATDVQYPTWLDTLKFSGDLRLRHDRIFATSNGSDRDRDRFRLRYGINAKSGDLTGVFRLSTSAGTVNTNPATVNGDPLSANQTEDTAFSRKGIWVDLAYLSYKPLDMVTLSGGKLDNPFWDGWSSSVFWDPDINPEGYAERFDLPLGLYFQAGQFSINEASGFHDADPWMFANRLGVNAGIGEGIRGMLSATDYGFIHEKQYPFGGDNKQGNTRATVNGNTNVLTSSFNVLDLDGKIKLNMMLIPITLEGAFVRNTQESVNKGRDGHIMGVTLGSASKAHTWEVAYYHKALGANAVIADFVDDDFGYSGTNQGGHIMWVGYAPRDNVLLKAMFYNTHILDTTLSANAPYTSHLMLDVVIKI